MPSSSTTVATNEPQPPPTKKSKSNTKETAAAAAVAAAVEPSPPPEPRLDALYGSWEGVYNTTQYRLAPKEYVANESAGVTVRAVCLVPLPIVSSKACTQEAVDAAKSKGAGVKPARPLNVVCMVTEIISTGWSHTPAAGAPPSVVGVSYSSNKNNSNNSNKNNNNNERVARFYGGRKDHALIHVHNTETRGTTVLRVGKSEDFFNVSVGTILMLPVWGTDMIDVFTSTPARDIPPLSMLTLELVSKGSRTTNKNAMLTVRRVREAPWLSLASRLAIPTTLALPSTMHEVEEYRRRFATGLHLLPSGLTVEAGTDEYKEALRAAGIEHLNQEYIAQNLSKHLALLHVVPKAGQFVIHADGTLRFVVDREIGLADIPFTDDECTLRVRIDDRQVPCMPQAPQAPQAPESEPPQIVIDYEGRREWGLAYLNLALRLGVVELLVAVNTQPPTDDHHSPTEAGHYAMVRFHWTPLLSQLSANRLPRLPEAIEARFVEERGARAMRGSPLVAFTLPSDPRLVLVVDLRVMVSTSTATATTLSLFMHRDDHWKRANEVFVFVDQELKFHAMAAASLPGGTATTLGGGGGESATLHRLLPSLPSLPRIHNNNKYEDERFNDDNDEEPH